MKSVFVGLLLYSSLFAYEKGDILSADLVKELGLTTNKIYVIDFFASWCGSCQKELPLISNAAQQIDLQKAEIIGIDVDKNEQDGLHFQAELKEKNQLRFKVINDPESHIISQFNPLGMPTLYFIKNAKVVHVIVGAVEDVDQKILNQL